MDGAVGSSTWLEMKVQHSTLRRILLLHTVIGAISVAAGRAPLLGWSTWCTEGQCGLDWCSSSEILSVVQALKDTGVQSAGFDHILVDDCWGIRNRTTHRIEADPDRFPEGMPALVQRIHDLGFKIGLYTGMGRGGCHAPFTGSWPYYDQDVRDFAAWEVDAIKFDYCDPPEGHDPAELTRNFSGAVRGGGGGGGGGMWLEFHCNGLTFEDARCGVYGDSFRVLDDHVDGYWSTKRVSKRLQRRSPWWGADSATQGWPDPDFFYAGGQGCGTDTNHTAGRRCPGQTDAEYRSEFGLWAIAGGQLVFATDPRNMSAIQRQLLLNSEVIQTVFLDTSGFGDIRAVPVSVPAPVPAPAPCTVALQQQLSHGDACVLGDSFGCVDGSGSGGNTTATVPSMYATKGCRGVFACSGTQGVLCESTADGSYFPANATCSCAPEPPQVWTRPLRAGSSHGSGGSGSGEGGAAVLLFNAGDEATVLSINFADITGRSWGRSTTLRVRDLWTHTELGASTGSFGAHVEPHDSVLVMMRA